MPYIAEPTAESTSPVSHGLNICTQLSQVFDTSLDDDVDVTAELLRCNSFDFVIDRAKALETVANTTLSDCRLPQPSLTLQRGPLRSGQAVVNATNRKSHYGLMYSGSESLEEIELDDLFEHPSLEQSAHLGDEQGSTSAMALPALAMRSPGSVSQGALHGEQHYKCVIARDYNDRDLEAAQHVEQNQRSSMAISRFVREVVKFLTGFF